MADDSAELWRQRALGWQPELPRHQGKDIGVFYDQRSAPAPTLKHTVSKGSIQEMSQHVDPRRRSRSLSDEAIQKTYEERYANKEKGD